MEGKKEEGKRRGLEGWYGKSKGVNQAVAKFTTLMPAGRFSEPISDIGQAGL